VTQTKSKGIVPAGIHVVTVLTAENQRVPWRRSPENPAGDVLTLRLSAGHEHRLIYTDLPIDKPSLMAIVAASFGIAAQDMQPEKLEGRTATVQIAYVQTRRGLDKPIVQAWLPAPAKQESAAKRL
jgi:hypothetical protein